jgi:hypothetical protein
MTIENVWARVSIAGISLLSSAAEKDVFVQGEIAGHRFVEALDPENSNDEMSRNLHLRNKYRLLLLFEDVNTNNKVRVYIQRRKGAESSPPVCLVFDSSYYNPVKYEDVLFVQKHFHKNYGLKFRVAEYHLATDLVSPEGDDDLHSEVCQSIRAGEEDNPKRKIPELTLTFGSPWSVPQLVVYNKAWELFKTEGIELKEQVTRIEAKFRDSKQDRYLPFQIHELTNFSWLYGEHFAFLRPTRKLREVLGIEASWLEIWELRELMSKKRRVKASKFYSDYVTEHQKFSKPVREALASYLWCDE